MTPGQLKVREWQQSPTQFVRDVFRVEPDLWQKEALEAFGSLDTNKYRISLQACAGPGKSAVLAWCGWNFLMTRCYETGEHPKGLVVAVTLDNLKTNLWPEFSKWQQRSELLKTVFKWTKEKIFCVQHPETWFLAARSFNKDADAEAQGRVLSGLHSKSVLFLIDESGEIPPSVLRSAEQALSNTRFGKIVQAGNPTSVSGMLYAAATMLRDQWHVIRITGDPDDPIRSPRISLEWARQQIKNYGRDNPWVMAYILGQFPPSSFNTLLGPDEVEAAMKRNVTKENFEHAQKRLGVDVARFGDDSTVLFPRQGLAAFKPVELRNARTQDIAARIAMAKKRWNHEVEFIDGTGGYGAGVIDSLISAGYTPQEIAFSGKSSDPRYFNKRSEMWFEMAEWVKRGGSLPRDPVLLRELTTPIYSFQNGKLRLEEKDQIKKRLGFSPDKADALALTFALPEMPRAPTDPISLLTQHNVHHAKCEWDPVDPARF